jgi:phage major head subunit gpT-like protein
MIINDRSLRDITTAYSALFQDAQGQVAPTWSRIALPAPSSGTETKLPWLNNIPGLRKWVGDRQFHSLAASAYEFPKVEFEDSIEVKNRDIESDQYGVYGPYMRMMGHAFAQFPDEQVWGALSQGFVTKCHDGKPFFSATHPVIGADGKTTNVSNFQDGAGPAWFLIASKHPLKPIVWSVRKETPFRQLTPPELVERNGKTEWGCYVDAGVGYAFWWLCYASKADLTPDNYDAARTAIMNFQGDHGRKLALDPDLLVVPSTLDRKARKICVSTLATGGETNEFAGTAEVLRSPWLS